MGKGLAKRYSKCRKITEWLASLQDLEEGRCFLDISMAQLVAIAHSAFAARLISGHILL